MSPLLHAISVVSAPAAGSLFSAIWEGAVLVVCAALCLRLLPGLSAAARSAVWTIVFLLLVLLHILPSLAERWSTGASAHSSPFLLDPRWSFAIAAVWALLSLWRGTQLIGGAIRSRGLVARAIPIPADAALQVLLHVKHGSICDRSVELCTSAEIERPSVFGFFHPRILLPPGLLEQFSAGDIEQIVMHEMEHLRRRDDWANLLQKIGLVLFPLNPVLLWVEHRLCAERELACDDSVLYSTGASKAYAMCLTRLAEFSMFRRNVSLALGAWEKRSELVRRIHRILRRPDDAIGGKRAAVLTSALVLAVLAGAVVLARTPQLISFAPRAESPMQAHSDPDSALQQVNLREFGGSPELVKAVMPQRRSQTPYSSGHRHQVAAKRNVKPIQPAPSRMAWVVLTEWEDSVPPPSVVFAISQDHRSSYAAVATPDGWLIVQI